MTQQAPAARVTDTALIPLIARAAAARRWPDLQFSDAWAADTVTRLGIDPTPERYNRAMMRGCVSRAKLYDDFCVKFIDTTAPTTIIQLGAGFETRPLRLRARLGQHVRWVDVDLPAVLAQRKDINFDSPAELISADLTDPSWVQAIPHLDSASLLISEGLTYHMSRHHVHTLMAATSAALPPRSVVMHDFMSPLMMRVHPGRKEVVGGFKSGFRNGRELFNGVAHLRHVADCWDLESESRLLAAVGKILRAQPVSPLRSGMYGIATGEIE